MSSLTTPDATPLVYGQEYLMTAFAYNSSTRTVFTGSGSGQPFKKLYYPLGYVMFKPTSAADNGQQIQYGEDFQIYWTYNKVGFVSQAAFCIDTTAGAHVATSGTPYYMRFESPSGKTGPVREGDTLSLLSSVSPNLTMRYANASGGPGWVPGGLKGHNSPDSGSGSCYLCGGSFSNCGNWTTFTYQVMDKTGTVTHKCTSSGDCTGGFACVNGKCTKIIPSTPSTPGDNGNGGGTEKKTFFQKYWPYLAGLALITLFALIAILSSGRRERAQQIKAEEVKLALLRAERGLPPN